MGVCLLRGRLRGVVSVAKRTSGEGTIYQRPDGLWRAEITLGYDENRKRIKKVFSSMDLDALHKKVNDFKYRHDRNMVVQKTDYTVYEWVSFWLRNYKCSGLKAKTYDSYEFSLDRYVKGALGGVRLDKLNTDMVQGFYNSLQERGLGATTVHVAHTVLSQSIDQAIKNGFLHVNPCKATVRPKKRKRKVLALTLDEQRDFVGGLGCSVYHRLFLFLFNTGLRVGEARALTWADVDFEKGVVTVDKTASSVKNRDAGDSAKTRIVIDSTKTTSSEREVPLNKIALGVCAALKHGSRGGLFVFSSKAGTILHERNINRALASHLRKVGIHNKYSVHSTRHTFATRLMEQGANPKVVSALLGHASVNITLDLYSHAMPGIKSEAVNLLDGFGFEPRAAEKSITTALPHL